MAYDSEHGKLWQDIKADLDKIRGRASKFAHDVEWAFGRRTVRVLVAVVLFAVVVALLVVILNWYVDPTKPGDKKDLVLAVAQILAGTALLSGLYFTWRTLQVNREGQITDRFTKAIDQLGKTDDNDPPNKIEEIRLGGIYALEQIALDEPDKYHGPIMQVLVAYLRRYAKWHSDPTKDIEVSADIQAVLNVIGRRSRYFGEGEDEVLGLGTKDFSSYTFPAGAHLESAWLGDSHLESAVLSGAQLKNAGLVGAHLQGAYLNAADLSEADLRGAHLEGAYLWNADLTGANLSGAYLTATDLRSITISEETTLEPESLQEANGERVTEIGEIPRPNWWGVLPGHNIPLWPGEYSIKLWKTLLHFHVIGTEWYSSLGLPYTLTLTPAGVETAGLGITVFTGPWVCDPQKPKKFYALNPAPKDICTWFQKHPLLTPTTQPQKWENLSGSAAGRQLYVEVNADIPEEKLDMSGTAEGPRVPVFPTEPRSGDFGLSVGKKNLVIVLESEDEWMVIVIEGSPEEFDKFKVRVDEELLASLYWGKKAHEHLEEGTARNF